jgi:D-arabinose 5-phosphate isomerase GutQ
MSISTASDGERLLAMARGLVDAEMRGLADLAGSLDGQLLRIAGRLVDVPGKVLTAGLGTSGLVARRMAHLLSVTGTPALFVHPADALHGTLGAVTADDAVIAISKGGQTTELNEFVRRARERGAWVVVITSEPASPFGQLGHETVVLQSPIEGEPGGMIAMGSTLVTAAWGDALAVVAMDLRGYRWNEVLSTHPGGAVGRMAPPGEEPGAVTVVPGHEV